MFSSRISRGPQRNAGSSRLMAVPTTSDRVAHALDFEAYALARGRDLQRLAWSLCLDAHLAEDLAQTVLVKVYREWDRVRAARDREAYVYRILLNAWHDQTRRRSHAERATDADTLAALDRRTTDDPADRAVERLELVRHLAGLPERQRAVLVLRHVEGLADDDIAAVLDVRVGTVRSAASRATATLSRLLREESS